MKKVIALFLIVVMAAAMLTGAIAENVQAEAVVEPTIIALGETVELIVAEAQAENAQTVWTTSDETIVIVDENGMATALNAGEAVITADVTTTTVDTVEKTVYEIVRENNAEGQLVTRREAKTVSEDVEKVENAEITINVVVEAALCPGCGAEYTSAEEYTAHVQTPVCGVEGHYVCDGIDHETELDEFCQNENPHRVCEAGVATHVCDSCGETYDCEDSGSHATCLACGNAWCYKDNGNHFTPACGKIEHRACVQENYKKNDHYRCSYCGDRRCDGDRHGKGKCVPADAE